jgi:uncharacterized protein
MQNIKLVPIIAFITLTLFSQEAWVSRVYNKAVSIDELTDKAGVIFKIERLSDFEVTATDETGRDVKLKYIKVKIIEILKSGGGVFSGNTMTIKSPPRSALQSLDEDAALTVGQVVSITDRSPLDRPAPPGKSYYKYHLENAADPKAKVALFFSDGYHKSLSVFCGTIGMGLVDVSQEKTLKRALEIRVYFDAVRSGQIENLKNAIKKFPKTINEADKVWGTPLLFASRYGKKAEIDLLLKSGASLSTSNGEGNSVLHDLVYSQSADNLPYIIQLSGDLNIKNKAGLTPLHLAVQRNASEKIIKILMDAGADPKIKDSKGESALDLAKTLANPEVLKALNIK